jgi:putative solute:sodium symporter small subunit
MANAPDVQHDRLSRFWRKTRCLTAWLLAAWFLLTFVVIFFARELATITVFGWPLSFYMAAQGLTLVYVGIIALYARCMNRLEGLLKEESAHVASNN